MPNTFLDYITWAGNSQTITVSPTTAPTSTGVVTNNPWAHEIMPASISPPAHWGEPELESQPFQGLQPGEIYGDPMPDLSPPIPMPPPSESVHPVIQPQVVYFPLYWQDSTYALRISDAVHAGGYMAEHMYRFVKDIVQKGQVAAKDILFNSYCTGPGASWGQSRFNTYWNKALDIVRGEEEVKSRPAFLECTFRQAFPNLRLRVVKGEIGLEIEAEGKNLFKSPIQYWGAVADGSLRAVDGHPPLEYVLRQPINRNEVLPALEYLSDRLVAAKSELKMSHRCSVHVHLNIQGMKVIDLVKFMTLYFIFEDMLVGWSGPERKGNLFCLRAKDAQYQVELLTDALRNNQWPGVFNQEMRYSAMNIASMGVHGSLEFRSMRGTVDITTIKNWVDVLTTLKDVATNFKSPESISRMFQSLGPDAFFDRVFRGKIKPSLMTAIKGGGSVNPHQSMWDCFRVVRDMAHAIDWENPPEYMKEVKGTRKKVSVEVEEVEEVDEDY